MKDRLELYVAGRPFDGGTYHYIESGLDNVFLLNGFSVEEDPEYGRLVSFHKADDLHRAIGVHLIQSPVGLRPREFRFLRKQMRITQAELARRFEVDPQTIANYEKGATPIPRPTDGFLRIQFMFEIVPENARAGFLKELAGISRAAKSKKDHDRKQVVSFWEEHTCLTALSARPNDNDIVLV